MISAHPTHTETAKKEFLKEKAAENEHKDFIKNESNKNQSKTDRIDDKVATLRLQHE